MPYYEAHIKSHRKPDSEIRAEKFNNIEQDQGYNGISKKR